MSSGDSYLPKGKDESAFKRRCNKWAMCAYKGGKCVACNERVTAANIEAMEFDHKTQINNSSDKSDRWGGHFGDSSPFSDRWFAWAETVDLVCKPCHLKRHRIKEQMDLDFEAIQGRLDQHNHGTTPSKQTKLWDAA